MGSGGHGVSAGRAAEGWRCGGTFRADVPPFWGHQTPDRGGTSGRDGGTTTNSRKPAHGNGVSCSRCSRSVWVCSRCRREQKTSITSMGYVRFSGLFPVFPVNQGDTRKEAHTRHAPARPVSGEFCGAGGQVAGLRLLGMTPGTLPFVGSSLAVPPGGNSRPKGPAVSAAEKGCTVNGGRWTPIANHYRCAALRRVLPGLTGAGNSRRVVGLFHGASQGG